MLRTLPALLLLLVVSGCLSLPQTPNLPVVNAPKRQATETVPSDGVITLRAGDTIYTVANRYKVTPRRIILANNLAPPYDLSSYRQLNIPKPRTHRVVAGDSLDSISTRYLVRKDDVIRLNALTEPYSLRPGMQIAIPRRMDYALLDDAKAPDLSAPAATQNQSAASGAAVVPANPSRQVRFVARAGDFAWPLDGEVIQAYGSTARGVRNDGVNIAAAQGAVVRASRGGEVAFVGSGLKAFGNLVLVKHEGGWITAYAHLGNVAVEEGQRVGQGDVLGSVGMTGRVDRPQLHFEIRQARKPVNPEDYLS
ncbi:MAG: peptidoglycan DD-metalloendopeptidase family protein [Candidatus Puniceispirillales bacterium]